MTEDTLVSAIMTAQGQIDFLWQFFVSVHIAIFALLFIYDHVIDNLNWVARIFAVAGIAAFEYINGNALSHTYMVLDAMLDQYRWSFGQAERFHPAFYEQFVLATYKSRPGIVMMTHSTALVVVLLAFISKRFIQLSPAAKPPAAHS